eukprot:CAMPEP_0113954584 /NCGR_PEP_ID=MMETSP0011_2-20120614/664_1 /TAXON_ID=101924 /ORGANISM="Rhodosorus marinus" /LENGTH=129 /DNA_ID=CAMNT_0000963789 /DNA_START=949 /DNA_END=1338 /DNA_ORIENTATION=+ /assembly_acc=CAM_ASM_000156
MAHLQGVKYHCFFPSEFPGSHQKKRHQSHCREVWPWMVVNGKAHPIEMVLREEAHFFYGVGVPLFHLAEVLLSNQVRVPLFPLAEVHPSREGHLRDHLFPFRQLFQSSILVQIHQLRPHQNPLAAANKS